MVDIKNLTRYPILDLKAELTANMVKEGRHKEFIKLFESYLKDTEYYCISQHNPIKPKIIEFYTGKCSRTYIAGGTSNYFVTSICEIEGYRTNAVIKKIYPKTARDFYDIDNYVVYLSKKDIDNFIENNK